MYYFDARSGRSMMSLTAHRAPASSDDESELFQVAPLVSNCAAVPGTGSFSPPGSKPSITR